MNIDNLGAFGREVGLWVRDLILNAANAIVAEYWPGLISAMLMLALMACALLIWFATASRLRALKYAMSSIARADYDGDFNVGKLEGDLSKQKGAPAKRLAVAFSEFRETLLEPSERERSGLRNSIRPSLFLNTDDLGYSLKGWRFAPSIFVSVGLLLTFLGLVAVLNTTQTMLNPDDTTIALKKLLEQASAKFIMSLTGLACSILLNLWLKFWSRKVETETERLANSLERKMDFISLEGLADRQLKEIQKQTSDMHELNTNLIAALSEPLKKVSESSMENVGTMVTQLS
jgi:HAMP domain-containing protein